MERILESRFHTTIAESLSGGGSSVIVDGEQLWKEFADMIDVAASENYPVKLYLRELFRLRAELRCLHFKAMDINDLSYILLIEKALELLESEIDLIKLGLRYPDIDGQAKSIVSTLTIAEGFSLTDLTEIIKGLHAIRFSRRFDGAFATLADLTTVFGAVFNVDFPHPDQKIHYTINRSKGPAQFLLRLVDCLVDLSRR